MDTSGHLSESYRTVIMLRDIEELSTAETAAALDLTEDNVKMRLHRGHGMIRNWLFERIGTGAKAAFPFMGARCDQFSKSRSLPDHFGSVHKRTDSRRARV